MKKILSITFLLLLPFLSHSEQLSGVEEIYGGSSTQPGHQVNRARGHSGGKDFILSGDIMNGIFGRGWNGTAFTSSNNASIELQAGETWSATANGTKILFKTTPLTTATPATALTVSSTGLSLLTNAAPRTNLTPLAAGTLVWNSADGQLCVSTGTATNSWVQVADGSTACSH